MVRIRPTIPFILLTLAILSEARDNRQTLCRVFVPDLVSRCARYARGSGPVSSPSRECCRVIKNTDVACACGHVNWFVERLVNMRKAVYVARACGIKLQPGSKCGSFKIPGGN
uniref:Bifunctional inhibitor/plant lipid transfer protein/seed storage helical domain-containing protein n=1 Tax=Kalanchoe fedtschenkoi TaxID=63787 RepID=A0A7N0VBC4_KALFE